MAELGDFLLQATSQFAPAKLDVSVDMLDYGYVNECKKVDELRAILGVLVSGKEGYYPDLIRHTENRLMECLPEKVRDKILRLRKETSFGDIAEAKNDLLEWQNNYSNPDRIKQHKPSAIFETADSIMEPPVRNSKKETLRAPQQATSKAENSRISGRDFVAWEKYDVDNALKKLDEVKPVPSIAKSQPVTKPQVPDNSRLSKEEIVKLAMREKLKGNESMRSKDYHDACRCYSNCLSYDIDDELRSIILCNRALANLKLDRFDVAERDCDDSLSSHWSVKCVMRRGMIKYKRGKYLDAIKDFKSCMDGNDEASQLYEKSVDKLIETSGDVGREMLKQYLSSLEPQQQHDDGSTWVSYANIIPSQYAHHSSKIQLSQSSMVELNDLSEREVKQLGNDLLTSGNNVGAEQIYTHGLSHHPSSQAMLSNRCLCRMTQGCFDSAIDDCNQLLMMDPTNIKALFRRSSCLHNKYLLHEDDDCLVKAKIDVDACLKLDGDNKECSELADAINRLLSDDLVVSKLMKHGLTQLSSSSVDSALTTFQTILNVNQHHDGALLNALKCLELNEKWVDIIALSSSSSSGAIIMIRCRAKLKTGDVSGCLSDARLIVDLNDDDDGCKQEAMTIIQNHQQELKPIYQIPVIEEDDDDDDVCKSIEYKDQGNLYLKAFDYTSAIDAYTRSIDCDPTNLASFNNRCLAHLKLGDYASCVVDADRVLDQDEGNTKALYRRGCAYRQMAGQSSDKRRALLISARNDLMRLESSSEAIEELQKVLQDLKTTDRPIAVPSSLPLPPRSAVIIKPPSRPPSSMYEFETDMHSLSGNMEAIASYLQLFRANTIKKVFVHDSIQPQELSSLLECIHTHLITRDALAAIRIMWGLCKLGNFDFLCQLMTESDRSHAKSAIDMLEARRDEFTQDSDKLSDLRSWL